MGQVDSLLPQAIATYLLNVRNLPLQATKRILSFMLSDVKCASCVTVNAIVIAFLSEALGLTPLSKSAFCL